MTKREKQTLMQKVYGCRYDENCSRCCNLQKSAYSVLKVCIAFGDVDYTDCTWDATTTACGIFNQPFHALKPRRVPIVEIYGPKPKENEDNSQQLTLF